MTRRLAVGERCFMRELERKRRNRMVNADERTALREGVTGAIVLDGTASSKRILHVTMRPEYEVRLLDVFERVLGFRPHVPRRQ